MVGVGPLTPNSKSNKKSSRPRATQASIKQDIKNTLRVSKDGHKVIQAMIRPPDDLQHPGWPDADNTKSFRANSNFIFDVTAPKALIGTDKKWDLFVVTDPNDIEQPVFMYARETGVEWMPSYKPTYANNEVMHDSKTIASISPSFEIFAGRKVSVSPDADAVGNCALSTANIGKEQQYWHHVADPKSPRLDNEGVAAVRVLSASITTHMNVEALHNTGHVFAQHLPAPIVGTETLTDEWREGHNHDSITNYATVCTNIPTEVNDLEAFGSITSTHAQEGSFTVNRILKLDNPYLPLSAKNTSFKVQKLTETYNLPGTDENTWETSVDEKHHLKFNPTKYSYSRRDIIPTIDQHWNTKKINDGPSFNLPIHHQFQNTHPGQDTYDATTLRTPIPPVPAPGSRYFSTRESVVNTSGTAEDWYSPSLVNKIPHSTTWGRSITIYKAIHSSATITIKVCRDMEKTPRIASTLVPMCSIPATPDIVAIMAGMRLLNELPALMPHSANDLGSFLSTAWHALRKRLPEIFDGVGSKAVAAAEGVMGPEIAPLANEVLRLIRPSIVNYANSGSIHGPARPAQPTQIPRPVTLRRNRAGRARRRANRLVGART